MQLPLRLTLALFTLFSIFSLGKAQTIDTIFGCDEIPNSPLAGASCTICNFDILYGTTFPFSASPDAGWCGSVENDQYIGFVAGPTGAVVFQMETFGCLNGQGVQVGIYDASNTLVGDCFNQVTPGNPQIFTASGLTPGTIYYMRIDGFAGDGCEFFIQVISGLISAGPDAPGPIMGPDRVCWDETYPYFLAPVPNATGYYWQLTPGPFTVGTTIDPPEATNPLVGTTSLGIEVEIPPMNLGMPPGTCDEILLTVFPLNPCFVSMDSSNFIIEVCRPTQDTTYADICIGGEYEFPPGSGEFFDTPFTFTTVQLDPGPSGCDTFGVLFLEQVNGGINPNIENVVLCEGDVAELCGFPDPAIVTGPAFCELEGASANGCDSIVFYNVLFLNPEAHIEPETGGISCTNLEETLWAVTRTGSIPPSTAGDTVSYVWTDATMTVIGNSESVNVTEPGTYTLTVNMTSDLDPTVVCSESVDITIVDNRVAPSPPALSGLTPVCSNDVPQDYTATGATGTDQYLWTVTPATGLTFSVGTDVLTITDFGTLSSAIVCVSTYNSCDTSTATCQVIDVLPLPTPATLPALDTLCQGDAATYPIGGYDANLTYTVSSSPAGSSATVNGSNIDFTMGSASGQLCLEVSNQCETLQPVCMDIVLRLPPVAVAPTGATDVCLGQVETYTLYTSLPFGTTASVAVTGGTITSQSANTATVEWTTAGTGQVCVTYTNVCGDDEACLAVNVATAGDAVMSGGGEYCEGNNDTEITITFTGAGPYDYTYLVDGVAVSGTSTTTPVVISAPAPGTYVLTGFTVGACEGTVSGSAIVEENPTPEATISGGGDICPGDDTTITIDFEGEAPWTYEVSLNSVGLGVNTTSDDPSILTVSAPGIYELVSVESDAGCVGTVSGSAVVDTLGSPVAGASSFDCSVDATTYTLSFPISGGDMGSYTVSPAGSGTITGGIFTSNDILSGDSYTFTVTDANGCSSAVVTGAETCECVTEIGVLDNTAQDICDDGTATDFSVVYDSTNEFLDPTDVRVYTLHTGSGTTIVGAIATNSTGVFAFDPATMTYGTTYYISVVVGDDDGAGGVDLADRCTLVALGVPSTWYVIPEAELVGGGDVCIGADSTVVVNFTGVGPFTIGYDIDGTAFTETTSDNPYIINLNNLQADVTVTLNTVATATCTGPATGTAAFDVHEEVQITADAVCNSTSTEFVVTIVISGGDPASYSVTPATGTLVGNTFTSDPIAAGNGYSFTVTDQWGCNSEVAEEPIVICNCISDAGTMEQTQITMCGPLDITVVMPLDTAMDSDDAINFVLHDGSGNSLGTVITQQAGTTFSFVPGVTQYGVVYYISSIMGNGVGGVVDLTDPCLDVAVGTPVQWLEEPNATLSGGGDFCEGDQIDLTFDITSAGPVVVEYTDGTNIYTANLPTGMSSIPAPLTTSATYTITSVTEGVCTGTFSGTAIVVVHGAPVVGTPTITFNSTFTEYQVTFDITMGDAPSYTVDGVALGGATTYTSAWISCGQDYTFVISDQYDCDPTTISSPVNCDCRTAVGSLAGNLATCDLTASTAPVYDATNENLDGDDAVEYILYLTDFNTPIQRGSSPNFSFDPGTMTTGTIYFIVAVAGNSTAGTVDLSDPCLVVSAPVTAAWYDQPDVTATAPTAICANEDWIITINVTGTPDPKSVYYTFNGVQDSLTGVIPGTASTLTFSSIASSSITITGVSDGDCASTANITLNVTVASEIFVTAIDDDNCNATGTEYFVTFEITGGDPSTYEVSPAGSGTITGNVFTSNAIASGTPYVYEVTDGSECFTIDVTGNRRCDCTTDAGQMTSTAMLFVCEGEDLSAGFSLGSEVLDANDQLLFALRTDDDRLDYTDDLLALSSTPVFPFDASYMRAGDTLYISPVAGDATGATIDTNDPCLSIGFATPIYIEYIPTGELQGDTIICEGGTAQITLVLTGNGPFDVTITQGDSGSDTTFTGINSGYTYEVDPVTGVIYVMNNITMSSLPQCSATPNSRVEVDVDELLTAGDEMAALVLCEGTGEVIQLSDQISGEDSGGSWTQVNGSAAGSDFNAGSGVVSNNNLAPGAYTFTYTVGSGAPCPQDAADVFVDIEAGPVVDAGPDQTITCDEPVVQLGAGTVPGYTYLWTGGPVDNETASQTMTSSTGTFTLIVSSGTAACEGRDEVVVGSSGDLPSFDNLLVRDVTCFGDTDGAIFTGVDGGTGPYSFSIDGGDTRLSGQFTNLTPGIHEITVEDSEGCVYTEVFIVEDAKEVVIDPGPSVEIPFGSSHLVELYLEGAIESVQWQGDSLECLSPGPICDRVMLYPQYSGTYLATARDSNGCTAQAPIQLIVRRDRPVGVPSGFSPDGDGNNDLVWVQAQEGILQEVSSFMIFDRWGEQVFATGAHQPNSPGFGWDGRLNGEMMNPQVFVYFAEIVYADGETDLIKGDITLIR